MPSGDSVRRPDAVPFQAHLDLLRLFLTRRETIVETIQGVLNAQRMPVDYLENRALLSHQFEDGFFAIADVTPGYARLRGRLEDAHWASGFRPRPIPGLENRLCDPAEMMVRAFYLWRQTRWPGRAGRVRYAHTLFNLYVIRSLALLGMRLWDDGPHGAGERLRQVQDVLDQVWRMSPADQPVLVRDARWLIPLAQSPATDDLGAYFEVAEAIAEGLPDEDRIAIHAASVRMTGGHLRSQIHYYSTKKGVPLDEPSLVANTRTSNALDFALLIQELVPLLGVYEQAWRREDAGARLELAGAICQGLSPDPELFVNRVELLGAYSMIEHLFITTDRGGRVVHTPMGARHVRLLQEYGARIGRLAKPLLDDCMRFRPVAGAYSPYGILYGFSSDLLGHMTLKAVQPDAVTRFSLEDVFADEGDAAARLDWVAGWRRLPHVPREVQKRFDYPQAFAEGIFERIEQALRRHVSAGEDAAGRTGRLFVQPAGSAALPVPELPIRYVGSSDRQLVNAHTAEARDDTQLASDRREGRCLVSYATPGGWVTISKAILTDVLGAGHDATIVGLPPAATRSLQLMCPGLIVLPSEASGHTETIPT